MQFSVLDGASFFSVIVEDLPAALIDYEIPKTDVKTTESASNVLRELTQLLVSPEFELAQLGGAQFRRPEERKCCKTNQSIVH